MIMDALTKAYPVCFSACTLTFTSWTKIIEIILRLRSIYNAYKNDECYHGYQHTMFSIYNSSVCGLKQTM